MVVLIRRMLYEANEWGKHQGGQVGLTQLFRQHGEDAVKKYCLQTQARTCEDRSKHKLTHCQHVGCEHTSAYLVHS